MIFNKKAFEIIANILETDVSKISTENSIAEWDSLAFIQIISTLDDEFNLKLPLETITEQAATAKTIGELLKVLGVG